jgi:hypothetical protein
MIDKCSITELLPTPVPEKEMKWRRGEQKYEENMKILL